MLCFSVNVYLSVNNMYSLKAPPTLVSRCTRLENKLRMLNCIANRRKNILYFSKNIITKI